MRRVEVHDVAPSGPKYIQHGTAFAVDRIARRGPHATEWCRPPRGSRVPNLAQKLGIGSDDWVARVRDAAEGGQ